MQEKRIPLVNPDGSEITLWRIGAVPSLKSKNVFLTHGTFSDKKVLKGMARYLVEQGYLCWVLEWRNHGHSSKNKLKFDFETIAHQDLITVFQYLFQQENIENIDCITHSGGGICLTIALIEHPLIQGHINSITLFACQAFGAGQNWSNYLKIFLGKYASQVMGKVPVRKVGGTEDEPYYFMKQWFDWNLTGQFISKTGIDYQARMKTVQVPVMSIYGAGDTFIAPPHGCAQYIDAFQNEQNRKLFCSLNYGFLEDYSHSRIILSRNSEQEIYPKVLAWMRKHSNGRK